MKSVLVIIFISVLLIISCTTKEPTYNQPVITSDTSAYNGRLHVNTYNTTGTKLQGVEVFIYPTYEDLKHNLYLNNLKSSSSGVIDFGYLMIGNYYLRASNNNLADTALIQVLSKRDVFKNMYLR